MGRDFGMDTTRFTPGWTDPGDQVSTALGCLPPGRSGTVPTHRAPAPACKPPVLSAARHPPPGAQPKPQISTAAIATVSALVTLGGYSFDLDPDEYLNQDVKRHTTRPLAAAG